MKMSLEAWDKDLIGKTVLGSAQFSVSKIMEDYYKNSDWVIPLENLKTKEYSGDVFITIRFIVSEIPRN